ncbi:MAG: serine hydrolase [Desulfatiglandaceae bacterium]
MDNSVHNLETFLRQGVSNGVYPGAVLLVAHRGIPVFFEAVGHRTLTPRPQPMRKDTVFDLASLTKPLATTLAIMKLVDSGKMVLDQPLQTLLPGAVPEDKAGIFLRAILGHCAGFAPWRPFYLNTTPASVMEKKGWVRKQLLHTPLLHPPLTATVYSDLGFMVLEWVIETQTGTTLSDFLHEHYFDPLSLKDMVFCRTDRPSPFETTRSAATEDCPWRNAVMQGVVHDENAYFVGGYSGHAGLFGTAEAVYALVNLLRQHYGEGPHDFLAPRTVRTFFSRHNLVSGSTWALGWDTPSQAGSSSGQHFSSQTVGHLGFTGTSIWMDLVRDVMVIFLTNRIHPTRKNQKIRHFRPALHDRVMEALVLG